MSEPRSVPTAPRKHCAWPAAIRSIAAVAAVAVAWSPTFAHMWGRWFPTWGRTGASLAERLTDGGSYYTHGPLVPLVSLIAAAFIYRRVGLPAGRSRRAAVAGWMLFALSCLAHLMSVYADVMFTSGLALAGVIGSLLLIAGGRPLARAYAAPTLLLLFMIPLPMHWIAGLNLALKTLAGRAALALTTSLFATPAVMDGSVVHLAPASDGAPQTLVIEDVCGGLRSLIALTWFAVLIALIGGARGRRRLALILAAGPIAVGCNILRIAMLNVGAARWGVTAAGPGGWLHEIGGLGVFCLALACQAALARALGRSQSPRPPAESQPFRPAPPARLAAAPTTALAAVALLTLTITPHARAQVRDEGVGLTAPQTLILDGVVCRGVDKPLDAHTLSILTPTDHLRRVYVGADGEAAELLIVSSRDNRKVAHPPQVCMRGQGRRILSSARRDIGAGLPTMGELVSEHRRRRAYTLYVYTCEGRHTCDYLTAQAWMIAARLTGRPAAGALVRLTVPIRSRDVDNARRRAALAVAQLWPRIAETLP